MKPWCHRKTGPVEITTLDGRPIYYRQTGGYFGIVDEVCLGERYVHVSPGLLFYNECYRGSTIDNWHGGPTGSLSELLRWLVKAEHPELGCSLWMVPSEP